MLDAPASAPVVSHTAVLGLTDLAPARPAVAPASKAETASLSGAVAGAPTSAGPAPATAAPPTGPPPFIADPSTEAEVAQDLIAAVDAQSRGTYDIAGTADNVALLESWMANEGGLWADNPLNTSLDAARYPHQITTSGQNTGIPIFPDIQTGIEATASTLLANQAYAGILSVLSLGDAACGTFAQAVIASPWAASHYGHDPSRFCGSSAGSTTVAVVTACLRVPKRAALRATRVPGTCGRFGSGGAAAHGPPSGAHRGTPRRASNRHGGPGRPRAHHSSAGRVGRHSAARWRR